MFAEPVFVRLMNTQKNMSTATVRLCILDCSNWSSPLDFDEGSVIKAMFLESAQDDYQLSIQQFHVKENEWPSNNQDVTTSNVGTDFDVRRVYDAVASNFDIVVISGSEDSVMDEHKHSYIPHLLQFIRLWVENNKYLLGICFGAQAISRALYGEHAVTDLSPGPEYGFIRMKGSFQRGDKMNSIFERMMVTNNQNEKVLVQTVCHGDCMDWSVLSASKQYVPELLASSQYCQVHAYHVPDRNFVLAVQFHPEFPVDVSTPLFSKLVEACNTSPAPKVHQEDFISSESIDFSRIQFARGVLSEVAKSL